jgi:hypothetical protein
MEKEPVFMPADPSIAARIHQLLNPAKASKPSAEASIKASSALIDELFDPRAEKQELALALMNASGSRIVALEAGTRCVGVWSDQDGPHIRAALHVLGMDGLEVRYLDGPNVPLRYKVRKVPGEPVSLSVRAEMEQHPDAPWEVRDRLWKQKKEKTN